MFLKLQAVFGNCFLKVTFDLLLLSMFLSHEKNDTPSVYLLQKYFETVAVKITYYYGKKGPFILIGSNVIICYVRLIFYVNANKLIFNSK